MLRYDCWFKVGNGLKLEDGSTPNLCNIALEYPIRQLSAGVKSTIFYKSVQVGRYVDDVNITARTKIPVSEAYKQLEDKSRARHQSRKNKSIGAK